MTNEPVQRDTTGDLAHPARAGAGLYRRAAPESTLPRAPRARHEIEPVLSLVCRRGRAGVVGAGPEGSARVAGAAGRGHDALRACRVIEPVLSLVCRRGRAAGGGAGPDGLARVPRTAERGHDSPLGRAVGDNRRATLRCWAASLTETAGRAPFEQHGPAAGEGMR
ncbi:DUF6380 family protein [Streptomyces hawaiiensis]|uniref:DUF6380 family protein n=1 Tax=Streptomyces hawaiiensis TaxID=67305 RepID=UPI003658B45C